MKKNYVIDTNMLLDDPNCIFGFEDNNVWITGTTIQELDKKKRSEYSDVRYNVKETGRILEKLRMKGRLTVFRLIMAELFLLLLRQVE